MDMFIALMYVLYSWFGGGADLLPSLAVPPMTATTTALVIHVIDGDTIDVQMADQPTPVRVRYIGIDTPEPYAHKTPDCGSHEATVRNTELVAGKLVTLVPGVDPYDKYHRLLAYVYVDDSFVNETLIREGYARVMMIPPNTQYKKSFTALYATAYTKQLGVWATCK